MKTSRLIKVKNIMFGSRTNRKLPSVLVVENGSSMSVVSCFLTRQKSMNEKEPTAGISAESRGNERQRSAINPPTPCGSGRAEP